jgi:cell shape-determining protein MreD
LKYLWLALFAFLVVLGQDLARTGMGNFFFPEISLLLVIFAGLRMKGREGAWLVFFLGVFFDALAGTAPGLQGLLYALVFLVSVAVSPVVNLRFLPFLLILVFLIVLGKELLAGGYDRYFLGASLGDGFGNFALSQAIILALVAPFFFLVMEKCRFLEKNEEAR